MKGLLLPGICVMLLLNCILAAPVADSADQPEEHTLATSRLPIRINGNGDFTVANGVSAGDGSQASPWIIEGWDISGHGYGYCIYIGNTTEHFIVSDCNIHDARQNFAMYYYTESGMILHRVSNGTVSGNLVHSNDFDGIYLHNSSHMMVESNTITGNRWGIVLMENSHNNTLQGNIVNESQDYGIGLIDSLRNLVSRNNLTGNANKGVYLAYSNQNSIAENGIQFSDAGIGLDSSDGNIVSANNITLNRDFGIDLWESAGNRIYHNNILDNGAQARDDTGSNSWDNGFPSGGNHWSDYTGTDVNRDGIGDAAYASIQGGMGARDRYPFVKEWFHDAEAPAAVAGPDMRVDEGTKVSFNGSGSSDNVGVAVYTWSFSDGQDDILLQGATPTYFFTMPGIFSVTLEVMDSAGNRGTDTMTVTVRDITHPIANAGEDMAVDEGGCAILNGSASSDNVGIEEFIWSFHDGVENVSLNGITQSHVFTLTGNYIVQLNVSDAAGNWDTDTMNVHVRPDSEPPVANAGPDQNASTGSIVTFNGSASSDNAGIANYTWAFRHNATAVELYGAEPQFTFWTAGNCTVTLVVRDAAGNSGNDSMSVTVKEIAEEPDEENATEDDYSDLDDQTGWLFPAAIAVAAIISAVLIFLVWLSRKNRNK